MRESSQVGEAFENATLKIKSGGSTVGRLKHHCVLICVDCEINITEKDDTAHVVLTKTMSHDIKSFCDLYKGNTVGKKHIYLYKSVNTETGCDFFTGKIKYEGKVICPDFDPDSTRQCGGGLHLSPTPELALSYNKGKVLKCKVALKDIVVYPTDITKVRCREVIAPKKFKGE